MHGGEKGMETNVKSMTFFRGFAGFVSKFAIQRKQTRGVCEAEHLTFLFTAEKRYQLAQIYFPSPHYK